MKETHLGNDVRCEDDAGSESGEEGASVVDSRSYIVPGNPLAPLTKGEIKKTGKVKRNRVDSRDGERADSRMRARAKTRLRDRAESRIRERAGSRMMHDNDCGRKSVLDIPSTHKDTGNVLHDDAHKALFGRSMTPVKSTASGHQSEYSPGFLPAIPKGRLPPLQTK